jgi:hypothetical protein
MRFFFNAIKEIPHPEEAHGAVSKDAGCSCSPSFSNSFTASEERLESLPRPELGARLEGRTTVIQLFVSIPSSAPQLQRFGLAKPDVSQVGRGKG